ncbi:MAG: hypothetical protein B9S36_05255 [Verrucomicrobiia bacterium Tous-C2TDCM]|nr:MAG: hypothetical protein B9S36_05255 [Verrucomicrobiae bacterium Tous-C2TDCM]
MADLHPPGRAQVRGAGNRRGDLAQSPQAPRRGGGAGAAPRHPAGGIRPAGRGAGGMDHPRGPGHPTLSQQV